jgi:hypothetical protein
VVIAALTLWFARELGITAGLFVLGSVVFSQRLTLFGRSLFWSLWAFSLPILAVTFFLERSRARRPLVLAAMVFAAFLLKCLFNGYEFITTTVVMVLAPLVYCASAEKWGGRKALQRGLVATIAAAAILVSALLLCVQFSISGRGFADGVQHIWYCLAKRTYGNPADFIGDSAAGLRAGLLPVLLQYITGIYFDARRFLNAPDTRAGWLLLNVRYLHLVAVFLAASVFVSASVAAPGRAGLEANTTPCC